MHLSSQVVSLVLPLVLIGLVITAGIVLYRIQSLSLPISTVTAAATIILPVITGVTLRGAQSFIGNGSSFGSRNSNVKHATFSRSSAIIITMIFFILFIYDTIIATLAFTYMVPPNDLKCHLESRWAWLFSNKNAEVIRRIQDRHQCCGFNSVRDRAWPFPDRSHTAVACHEAFGRVRSCFGGWRGDEQVTGGMILLVAVVAFLVKLLVLWLYQTHHPFQLSTTRSAFLANGGDERSGNDNNQSRRNEIEYHDDDDEPLPHHHHPRYTTTDDSSAPGEGPEEENARTGPAVQPSAIHGNNNGSEWREV